MGIVVLVFLSIGIYQFGKWVVVKALPKRDVATATETQPTQSEAVHQIEQIEQNWSVHDIPTFLRRGMPYPVLNPVPVKKKKARVRKPKLNAAAAPLKGVFPLGDWTLFVNIEGGHHVTAH